MKRMTTAFVVLACLSAAPAIAGGLDPAVVPMGGKSWQGQVEVDESSGVQRVQVAVPVVDGGKPIGSLVVGLAIAKLK